MRRYQQLIRTYTLRLATLGVFSAAANAQLFNVDFGDQLITFDCASTYAAAGTAGVWNTVYACQGPTFSLVDKSGTATGVTLSKSSGMYGCWNVPDPAYVGEDANLMQDFTYGSPGTTEWIELSGLANGSYTVYSYSRAIGLSVDVTGVDCPESTDGVQLVGGVPWPGSHQQLKSYARHIATVTSGVLRIEVTSIAGSWPSLNGIQIELDGIGTNYCGPGVANSTGSAGVMSASGSTLASDADLLIQASNLPDGQFAYMIASRTQGFVAGPGGSQGNLCILGNIARFNRAGEVGAVAGGQFSLQLPMGDFPEPPSNGVAVMAGDTWNFQCWHRDFVGGSPTSNFSDALEVTFQ